jgi:hypothetical protein
MRYPITAVCALAIGGCADDGGDEILHHEHVDSAQSTEFRRCQTDEIVDALGTALAASRKYQDVAVAEAEGYTPVSKCETSADGTMGIHYAHPNKLAALPDVADPAILLYLPTPAGMRLVAIEYFEPVIQDGEPYMGSASEPPREDSLPKRPPEIFDGQPFDGPMAGHNPDMPWHYDQHVWLYADNPDGLFAMWNPAIECPPEAEPEPDP